MQLCLLNAKSDSFLQLIRYKNHQLSHVNVPLVSLRLTHLKDVSRCRRLLSFHYVFKGILVVVTHKIYNRSVRPSHFCDVCQQNVIAGASCRREVALQRRGFRFGLDED